DYSQLPAGPSDKSKRVGRLELGRRLDALQSTTAVGELFSRARELGFAPEGQTTVAAEPTTPFGAESRRGTELFGAGLGRKQRRRGQQPELDLLGGAHRGQMHGVVRPEYAAFTCHTPDGQRAA